MLSLEEQIHNLADAAFDATQPVMLPVRSGRSRGRTRLLAVAAAVVVLGLFGVAVLMTMGGQSDLIVAADIPAQVVEITDPMDIDLTDVARESSQVRIQRLGTVTVVDTDALLDTVIVLQRETLITTASPSGPYEYWQQVSVRTPETLGLVVNAFGTEASWPPLEESLGDEVVVRGRSGRQSSSSLVWLENDQLRIEIVRGPGTRIANIDIDRLELAEALTFVESADGWTDDGEDRLGLPADRDPILAGTIAGIEWNVVENGGELVVRTGDRDRVAFTHRHDQDDRADGVGYSVNPLAIPGGALIVGSAPAGVDQIEVVLEGGGRVIMPTVEIDGGRSAFAVPVDDRLDPIEIRLVSSGVRVGRAIDVSYLPPYLGGSLTVGS